MDFYLGDILTLKKPHPCGSSEWRVVRLGADIGIKCMMCGHRVLLPRPEITRKVKSASRAADSQAG
ncbi:DUF951 domain-containing protein [Chloroflexota bacterium]